MDMMRAYPMASAAAGGALVAMTPLKSILPLPIAVHLAVGGIAMNVAIGSTPLAPGQAMLQDAVAGVAGGMAAAMMMGGGSRLY